MGSECTVPSGRAGIRDFTSAFNAPDKIIMLLGIQLLLIWCPFFLTANQELQPAESTVMSQTPRWSWFLFSVGLLCVWGWG